MALVLKTLYNGYQYYFNEFKDPRVENYPLLGSPVPLVMIVVGYLYFVKSLGPKLMANRKPFELNNIMMVYNLLQVVLNTTLCIYGTYWSYYQDYYSFRCQGIDYGTNAKAMTEVLCTYLYFCLKISDLLDTIFFVLRKKDGHLTFLHIYHHTGMIVGSYICAKFMPGGHASLLGLINCFVHSVMYFYYFLTSFKPEMKNSIWWKKHITQIQMIQFAILFIHFLRPVVTVNDCGYPNFWLCTAGIQNLFMFILFGDFYLRTYGKRKQSKK